MSMTTLSPSGLRFANKVFVVTGGTHGIGRAVVRHLLRDGARVATFGLHASELASLAAERITFGDRLMVKFGDVADATFTGPLISRIQADWGRLDGWVNNAMTNPKNTVENLTEADLLRAFTVGILGPFRCLQETLSLLEISHGSVVNIGSIMARQTEARSLAYTMVKSAQEGFTRGLAVELAPKRIRVNTVVPGLILTDDAWTQEGLSPDEREQEPARQARNKLKAKGISSQPWPEPGCAEDCAEAVAFLLSDEARFITGTELVVDGGMQADLRAGWNPATARKVLAFHQDPTPPCPPAT